MTLLSIVSRPFKKQDRAGGSGRASEICRHARARTRTHMYIRIGSERARKGGRAEGRGRTLNHPSNERDATSRF
jgi:hypothetical protein